MKVQVIKYYLQAHLEYLVRCHKVEFLLDPYLATLNNVLTLCVIHIPYFFEQTPPLNSSSVCSIHKSMQIISDGLISLELFVLYDSFPWLTAELGGCVSNSHHYITHTYLIQPLLMTVTFQRHRPQLVAILKQQLHKSCRKTSSDKKIVAVASDPVYDSHIYYYSTHFECIALFEAQCCTYPGGWVAPCDHGTSARQHN